LEKELPLTWKQAKSMLIRKISIGTDPLDSMNFQVGGSVLSNSHEISEIKKTDNGFDVWVKNKDQEIIKWKSIINMPVMVEHYLEF
jgi:hypothetical protein